MTRFDEPLDLDLFSAGSIDLRVDGLFHLRRSTHRAIVNFGAVAWAGAEEGTRSLYAPPAISALPAREQPKALAVDEAARIAGAHLYGLDEAATAAAVTLGSQLPDFAPGQAEQLTSPVLVGEGFVPPAASGLLRWASGIGYCCDGTPITACHWGAIPEGIWLSWWADNRIATQTDVAQRGRTRQQAQQLLREMGPLAFSDFSQILYTAPQTELPELLDCPLPSSPEIARRLALSATVIASWALLTAPGAARLITRRPTPVQALQDKDAGLTPRPATLATGPIDTRPIHRALGRS